MSNTFEPGVKKSKKTARKRTKLSIEQITTNLANIAINYSSTNFHCSSTESNNHPMTTTHASFSPTHVSSPNPHVDFVRLTNQEIMCDISSWNDANQFAIRLRQSIKPDEETAQFKEISDAYEELLFDLKNVLEQTIETIQERSSFQNQPY